MAVFNNDANLLTNNSCLPLSHAKNTGSTDDNEEPEVEYPLNTKPLQNQVAGHAFKDGKHSVGMLKHNDGYVLKPVNWPIQGEKEIKFYEKIQNVTDPLLVELKSFIPEYYGTTVLDLHGKKVTFLLLKDITNGFEEPCIMDIKIGKQTWEPGASIEKQLSEQKKYTECKKHLSFCIPGFQTYDIKTGGFQQFRKEYGKQLDVKGVYNAFRIFFNAEHGKGEHLISPILDRLKRILNWWKKQNLFHIYSSSVLLAYNAAFVRKTLHSGYSKTCKTLPNHVKHSLNSSCDSDATKIIPNTESWLCVYLIDFAHVMPADKNSSDFNYIEGLVSLINVFEDLLAEFRFQQTEKMSEKS